MKIDVASPSGAKMRNDIMFNSFDTVTFTDRLSSLQILFSGQRQPETKTWVNSHLTDAHQATIMSSALQRGP